ncbi:MAG: hypothetical protein GQ553_03715 [Nitrosomonadaceae bacterium]|nr:hypothetical protein [Nitrosomonadaceae bacterium]
MISNQLKAHLETIEGLEKRRAKEYGHQVVLNTDEAAGYSNLTRSIMHYEGRTKEARSILRIIGDVELRVRADKCRCCDHHEIGTVDLDGKFTALKPGQRILIRKDK